MNIEAGAETAVLDLRELDLAMYNPEIRDPPAGAQRLLEVASAADGMIWRPGTAGSR